MHVISKRKGMVGVSIILLAIVLCGCSSSEEKWSLELLEEVPYNEISSEVIVASEAPFPCFITNTEISFFAYGKQCILDLNTLHFESFGSRGKGPGEFEGAWGQSMVTIGDRKYCIDESKMSMMIFNAQNEFLKEIKLDYMPCSIFKLPDDKLGIIRYPSGSDNKVVSVHSPEGEFIEEIVPAPKSLYGYEGPLRVDFRYRNSTCFQRGDYIYIFLGGIPVIHKYNLKTGQNELINYENEFPFKPTKPLTGPEHIADLFHVFLAGVDNNYVIFKILNRKTVHEVKGDLCLLRFNFINDEIEIIEIVNKDEILTEDPLNYLYMWVIHNDKFYIFDDVNETLLIYKIRKAGR